jgi:hypothetical protein
MCDSWKLRGGTPEESKIADKCALGNLTSLGVKRSWILELWQDGHKSFKCTAENKIRVIKVAAIKVAAIGGDGNKKKCDHCGRDTHTEAECFRKPKHSG